LNIKQRKGNSQQNRKVVDSKLE